MGEFSKIQWTDHTFNPWIGCQKVSPGCDHCYAETMMDHRYGRVQWGPHGERKRTSEDYWKQPRRWAKAARASGSRPRVFCASLADVFDNKVPKVWRYELWDRIAETPELDWLILTKRPENIRKMLPTTWRSGWSHVWLGATAEDQEHFDHRWSILGSIPAVVRFISYEPALGALQLPRGALPDWIICGGESGPHARRMDLQWAQSLRDQCALRGVAFFLKQLGENSGVTGVTRHGDDPSQWPRELRTREYPK